MASKFDAQYSFSQSSLVKESAAKRVTGYCVCTSFNLKQLQRKLTKTQHCITHRWDEALYVTAPTNENNDSGLDRKEAFVLEFGVLVLWGYTIDEEEQFLELAVMHEF